MAQQRRKKNRAKIKAAYLKRGDMYNRRREFTKAKAAFLKVLAIDAVTYPKSRNSHGTQ